jgi:hypothetical protein
MAQLQNRVSRRLGWQVLVCFAEGVAVKHAPCGPVFMPVDRGPEAARVRIGKSARGHHVSLRCYGMPSGTAPSLSEIGGILTEIRTIVNVKVTTNQAALRGSKSSKIFTIRAASVFSKAIICLFTGIPLS